ncbi:MAG: AzlD domain-containing protein [Myxococcales bacterium]|nr:MAG: AzlD domain-containing protein [Myxococcales bacterium]
MTNFAWLCTLVVAIGTLLIRASFLTLYPADRLPYRVKQGLQFLPAAALSGLVAYTLQSGLTLEFSLTNIARVIALAVATVVAQRTKKIVWTLLSGLAVMWLLNAF